MADVESSELSSLSSLSPAPSDDEGDVELKQDKGILKFFHKLPKGTKPAAPERDASPPAPKRAPSPPHDYVLADNPDIAFIVMFRSRFNDAFPKSLPNFGPQELERDVTESIPGSRVEQFLCAVLGLLLNRKQDVKPGHYNRALEDAISTHRNQWPRAWEDKNPLAGGNTFASMNPTQRLTFLRALILWTLSSSEVVKGIIQKSYKQNRHEDDLNQPLSVQPWGSDSDKRRYYLVEGLDDTAFRVYRESNPQGFNRTWWSVAGSIEELHALADRLQTVDGGPKARKLAQQMLNAVPRFEATEEKRRRREYRQAQKERFKRPEPGFSMYEGRTRGKRMKYTYSDDEDFLTEDSSGARRSARNTGTHTPAEPAGPVTTASGRQVKAPSRMTVDAANNLVTTSPDGGGGDNETVRSKSKESSVGPTGRPRRSAAVNHGTNGWASSTAKTRNARSYNSMDDEEDDESSPDLGDDEEEDHVPDDESEEEDEDEEDEDEEMGEDGDDLDSGKKNAAKSHIITMKISPTEKNTKKLNLDDYRHKRPDIQPPTTTAAEPAEDSKESFGIPQQEERSEESIAVATTAKNGRATPEPTTNSSEANHAETKSAAAAGDSKAEEQQQSPQKAPGTPGPTPTALPPSTSLAYRKSPDKTKQAVAPPPPQQQPLDVAGQ